MRACESAYWPISGSSSRTTPAVTAFDVKSGEVAWRTGLGRDDGTCAICPVAAGGKVFVAISNAAATPINGAFANLPDGSTFTVGSNTYQASYEGGDGNDLTLTVVP